MSEPRLTKARLETLRAIEQFAADGLPPTLRELCGVFGVTTYAVVCRLEPLRKAGLVTWIPNCSRTLRLTPSGREVLARMGGAR